jgi:hypothetical protein
LDDGAPTFDPEEADASFSDEYMAGDLVPDTRFLQTFDPDYPNATSPNGTVTEPPPETSIPMVPLALVGLGGVGAAAYFMTRPGYTYETHNYDHAADSGLLDHPEYDLEYDDGSDYDEYDE